MSKYSYLADIKPDAYRPPTREEIEGAREWYIHGFAVSRILARWNMSLGTLYYWLDGGPVVGPEGGQASAEPGAAPRPDALPASAFASKASADRSGEREKPEALARGGEPQRLLPPHRLLPRIPRRKQVLGKRRRPLRGDRASLTARLWRTTERQVRDIEERLARPSASSPERERDVRMLASLVRTLRDLSAFDNVFDLGGAAEREAAAGIPEPERDIDDLRASVMQKLQNIVDRRDNTAENPE